MEFLKVNIIFYQQMTQSLLTLINYLNERCKSITKCNWYRIVFIHKNAQYLHMKIILRN